MGDKVSIVAAGGHDCFLGEIDAQGLIYAERRGTIVGSSARQLQKLLGNGYGRIRFHMLLDELRLEDCQVVSPHMVFTYRAEVIIHDTDIDELGADDTWQE